MDPRHISQGRIIPTDNYSDQPYMVKTDDGAWLCVVTTGAGKEGEPGQHVISMRSTDRGLSWDAPVDVEPADGPEASYAVLLKAPSGRIFCFYNHNTDNLRKVKADDPPMKGGYWTRVDSQGHYVFKYSDDNGRSWSPDRTEIPVRMFKLDRDNPYGGSVRFFWNVGRPFTLDGSAFVTLHKIGRFGEGGYAFSQGALLKSPDLLSQGDPARASWETLPDGEIGLRTPPGGGPISEEQCCVPLSDGSLFCVYRTIDGRACHGYSRDGGHNWTVPEYMRFANGRAMKHPRAANFVWRMKNGKYVYWFHNHGWKWYDGRNPVWISGGTEVDTPDGRVIAWSQPEILLYEDDIGIRMSYPDLIEEDDGKVYITETQKNLARVHEIDRTLLEGLWMQGEKLPAPEAPSLRMEDLADAVEIAMPILPDFNITDRNAHDLRTLDLRNGFTLGFTARWAQWRDHQVLLDTMSPAGCGLRVAMAEDRRLCLTMSDGMFTCLAYSDEIPSDGRHHIAILVDGGPKVMTFVVDGKLPNGGEERPYGWARFARDMLHANGRDKMALSGAHFDALWLYPRALRISEVISLQYA